MANKKTRIVQTCSQCNKTGHNKRRCSAVPKKKTVVTAKKDKKHVHDPITVSHVTHDMFDIHEGDDSERDAFADSDEPYDMVADAPPVPRVSTKKHFVPVIIQKTAQKTAHVVDLSEKKQKDAPSWNAIQSFRERMKETVERQPFDFADAIRKSHASRPSPRAYGQVRPQPLREKVVVATETSPAPTTARRRMQAQQKKSRQKSRRQLSMPRIRVPQISRVRLLPALLAFLLIVGIPLPAFTMYQNIREDSAHVLAVSTSAFLSLQASTSAAFDSDTAGAEASLQDALAQFSEVESIVNNDYRVLTDVVSTLPIIGKQVSSRRSLLNAGQHIALGNTYVLKGVKEAQAPGDLPMTERLSIIQLHMQQALPQYEEAKRALRDINASVLPADQRQAFETFVTVFSTFVDDMHDLTDLSGILYDIFGGNDFRRYLVLFQNSSEIRPTGGFIGSYAILDTQKGRIENIDIPGGGTYDIQGQLDEYLIPPTPLQLVNSRWELQDANWFFDFPSSARKAESFVSNAKGMTFDGTIAVNASVIERLLRVIGPVEASLYDLLLDADTVLPTLQAHVEDEYEDPAAPKQILSDVFDELLGAMQHVDPDQLLSLLHELHDALSEKEIQIALHDAPAAQKLESFGWTGAIASTAPRQDYLAVVATNVQGQKSDARIEQEVSHVASVQDDGSVIVTLRITRTHTGDPEETYYGASNIAYMRTYVPDGSVLLDASGFSYPPESAFHVPEEWYQEDPDLVRIEQEVGIHKETGTRITNEFGKTVFGNWMMLPAGSSSTITFTYRLPFSIVDKKVDQNIFTEFFSQSPEAVSRYSLLVQKQSGVASTLAASVIYPDNWTPRWKSDDTVLLTSSGAMVTGPLTTDKIFGAVFEQHK